MQNPSEPHASRSICPHPNPLPEGEGTVRGGLARLRPIRRRTWAALAALAVLVVLHPLLLRMLTWPLRSAAAASPGDYYCLHGGEMGIDGYRPLDRAAKWQATTRRKILLLTPHMHRVVEIGAVRPFEQTCRDELAKRGISASDVETVNAEAHDAWNEARALSQWLKEHPNATVELSCTAMASGRLTYIFNKTLAVNERQRVVFDLSSDPDRPPESWWHTRDGVKDFMYAWLELIYAWCHRNADPVTEPSAAAFQNEIRATIGEAPR